MGFERVPFKKENDKNKKYLFKNNKTKQAGNVSLSCLAFSFMKSRSPVKSVTMKETARKVAQRIREGRKVSLGAEMVKSGYSKAYASHSNRLKNSPGFQELLKEYLGDEYLLQKHRNLLESKDWRAVDAGLDKAYKLAGHYQNSTDNSTGTTNYILAQIYNEKNKEKLIKPKSAEYSEVPEE